jgi:acyl carrier protein
MMDRAALLRSLGEILENNQGEPFNDLDENTVLREGLGLDSVDVVTLVIEIQDRFGIHLSSNELEDIQMVGDLLDRLESKNGRMARTV